MEEMEKLLKNYRLATAEILYHLPDHPLLLQSYTWQEYDLVPQFPMLRKFLEFWNRTLEGKIHSVKVMNSELIKPANVRLIAHEFLLS